MPRISLALALLVLPVLASAQVNEAVRSQAQAEQQPMLDTMRDLVAIESGSSDPEGLARIAALIAGRMRALGGEVEMVPASPDSQRFSSTPEKLGETLVARFRGRGTRRILLLAHMDTVYQRGDLTKQPFRIDGDRAYGPGVMDNKGGVVTGIAVLGMLKRLGFRDYAQLTFFLNTNEETGSRGSRALIEQLAREHDVVLNLEPGREPDGLVVERKGSGSIALEVKGKAAHAGIAPDQGRNAAMEAAHQVLQLSRLGDPDKRTSVNFTVIKAGDRGNVIPDSASAQADVRVALPEEYARLERDLARISANKLIPDTQVSATLNRSSPPMPRNAATDALAARATAIYAELGRTLSLQTTGGSADANWSAGVGTPTIDGLGIVGGAIHTPEEYAQLSSMAPRFYLLARLVMELGARGR
jgi:glutamate carboxypeptidase